MSARYVLIGLGHSQHLALPADHPQLGAALAVLASAIPVEEATYSRKTLDSASRWIPAETEQLVITTVTAAEVVLDPAQAATVRAAEDEARAAMHAKWKAEDEARKAQAVQP